MLYIRQKETNILYLNLMERNTWAMAKSPVTWSWLINFTNDFTKESATLLWILYDSSIAKHDTEMVAVPIAECTGTSVVTPDGLKQEIRLSPKGYWSYTIYTQDSLTNLTITTPGISITPIQTGKAFVSSDKSEISYTETATGNPTNYIYVP